MRLYINRHRRSSLQRMKILKSSIKRISKMLTLRVFDALCGACCCAKYAGQTLSTNKRAPYVAMSFGV